MEIRTSPWPDGVPCWADLTVADAGVTQAFYAAVLGWHFEDLGDDEAGEYVVATVRGAAVAGLRPRSDSATVTWTIYIATSDVDSSAASAAAHGGRVIRPPHDVGGLGRRALVADPGGAVFGLWQAGTHIGAGICSEPGSMTWGDLRSTCPETARAFYVSLFGYRTQPLPVAGPDYHLFASSTGQYSLGGMSGMMGEEGMPSHWLVYFAVADADAAISAAEARGGTLLASAFDTPFGRMAALSDPAGAAFWIAQPPDDQPWPDRTGARAR